MSQSLQILNSDGGVKCHSHSTPIETPSIQNLTTAIPSALPGYSALKVASSHRSICQETVRNPSSAPPPPSLPKAPVLVRDFILDSLYNPSYGYFASQEAVVGRIPEPIDFNQLWGKGAYTQMLSKLYQEIGSSWLTPVELFQPWYGYAFAEFIRQTSVGSQLPETGAKDAEPWLATKSRRKQALRHSKPFHDGKGPLRIYEIGGGCGTCALNVLDYFEQQEPEIYKRIQYTSVEISNSLAAEQRKTVHAKPQHKSKFKVQVRNAADRAGWGPPSDEPCFVIMLEVLDNLAHDRVFRSSRYDPWLETLVTSSQPEMTSPESISARTTPPGHVRNPFSPPLVYRELLAPVRDPLIQRCLAALEPGELDGHPPSESGHSGEKLKPNVTGLLALAREFFGGLAEPPEGLEVLWLPTGALQMLETLYAARPNMCLIAADFDALPDVRIEGRNAPLVASKADGVTQDQSTYLVQPGTADIFFPTDFDVLHRLNMAAAQSSKAGHVPVANSARTRTFMEQFGDVKRTRTRTGFNPLLEDYLNTKVFVSQPGSRLDEAQ